MNQYHISILALVLTVTIAVPTKLTTSNYEAYVSQNPVVILHLYQGQCGHCEMLHQELDRLKELLNDKNYGIAEVSCTESSPVCSKFTSQRMPGVIVVARGAPVEYHGDLTAEDFNDWILQMLDPPMQPIEQSAVAAKRKSQNFVLIGGLTDADRILLSAATRIRFIGVPFYQVQSDKTFITLYLKEDGTQIAYQTPIVPFNFAYEVFHRARPFILPLDSPRYSFYFQTQKDSENVLIFFDHGDNKTSQMRDVLNRFCQYYIVQVPCFTVSKEMGDYLKLAKRFKVNQNESSLIVYLTNRYDTIFHYNPPILTYNELQLYVKKANEQKIIPLQQEKAKNQDVQYNFAKVLDSRSYYVTVREQPFVFVEYYSSSCPHCVNFAQQYDSVAEHFQSASDVIVAAVSADKEAKIVEAAGIDKFPTFKLFVRGEVLDYRGDRNAKAMIEFITEFSRSKLLVVPYVKDIKGQAVAISGIDSHSSLNSLPALFRRYPIYYVSKEEGTKVQLIGKTIKAYSGEFDLVSVADWLQEETAPVLLSLGESPSSRKLEKAMEKTKPILGLINKGEEGSLQSALKVLQDYCSSITDYVCGYLQKGQHDYKSMISWIGDPETSRNRLVWIDTKALKVYLFDGSLENLSAQQVDSFVKGVKSGKIKNHQRQKIQSLQEQTNEKQVNQQL